MTAAERYERDRVKARNHGALAGTLRAALSHGDMPQWLRDMAEQRLAEYDALYPLPATKEAA